MTEKMRRIRRLVLAAAGTFFFFVFWIATGFAQIQAAPRNTQKVIIDTDIGDDIDDAFAVALALRSPELQILGITTTFRDTEARAKLVDRMLGEVGRADIPVAAGVPTPPKTDCTQRKYAEGGRFAKASHPDAVTFLLDAIRKN